MVSSKILCKFSEVICWTTLYIYVHDDLCCNYSSDIRENVCCKQSSSELERETAHLLSPFVAFFVVVNNPFVALEQLRLHEFDAIVTQVMYDEVGLSIHDFVRLAKSDIRTLPPILLLCDQGQRPQIMNEETLVPYPCIEEVVCGGMFLRTLCANIKCIIIRSGRSLAAENHAHDRMRMFTDIGGSRYHQLPSAFPFLEL